MLHRVRIETWVDDPDTANEVLDEQEMALLRLEVGEGAIKKMIAAYVAENPEENWDLDEIDAGSEEESYFVGLPELIGLLKEDENPRSRVMTEQSVREVGSDYDYADWVGGFFIRRVVRYDPLPMKASP